MNIVERNTIPFEHLTPELARKGVFVTGMPNADYHQHEGISNSGLSSIARSPAHHKAGTWQQTRAKVVGTAFHCCSLEPEVFAQDYMLLPKVKARTAAEYKEAARTFGPDYVLIASEAENVAGMMQAIRDSDDEEINTAHDVPGWRELSAFVEDPETGVLMRCRFDLLTHILDAIDLKKTQDVRHDEFSKSVSNYRYHVQQVMYSDIFRLITGESLKSFKFLAVEEKSPHTPAMWELDDEALEIGAYLYRRDIQTYAECANNEKWPGPVVGGSMALPYCSVMEYENSIEESIT